MKNDIEYSVAYEESIKMWVVFYQQDRPDSLGERDYETGEQLSPIMCDEIVVTYCPSKEIAESIIRAIKEKESLESQVKELREAGNALIEAMNQKSFFLDGYANGSASISEARHASEQEHAAYSKMFDVLKSLNKQP